MNEAIKLAIEKGGYSLPHWKQDGRTIIISIDETYIYYKRVLQMGSAGSPQQDRLSNYWDKVILDPLFWQALGKALGWKDMVVEDSYQLTTEGMMTYQAGTEREMPKWSYYAHQYFDLVLTGGDTEKFWNELHLNDGSTLQK